MQTISYQGLKITHQIQNKIEDDLVESIKSYASKKSKGIIDKEFLKSKNKSE